MLESYNYRGHVYRRGDRIMVNEAPFYARGVPSDAKFDRLCVIREINEAGRFYVACQGKQLPSMLWINPIWITGPAPAPVDVLG